jgi:hypothetical protein
MNKSLQQTVRLSIFFFLLLFLSGRIGLLLHEFAGHALSWRILGGNLSEFRLFLFGGGWVRYEWPLYAEALPVASMLFIQLTGIGVELVVGGLFALLALFIRTNCALNALLIATASVLVVHSFFYLFVCTYYGSGDGSLLYKGIQGTMRTGFLILTFGLTVGGAFLVSYGFSPVVRNWVVERSHKKKIVVIVLSGLFAVLLHAVLTLGEKKLIQDEVYAGIKTPENVRLKKEELSQFITTYMQEQGRVPDPEEMAIAARALEEKYGQFPIEISLGIAAFSALITGFILSQNRVLDRPGPVSLKDNAVLGCVSVLTAMLICLLNRL